MDQVTEADVFRSLGELHAKVDNLLAEKAIHNIRISKLESWLWSLTGGIGCFTAFFIWKFRTLIGL